MECPYVDVSCVLIRYRYNDTGWRIFQEGCVYSSTTYCFVAKGTIKSEEVAKGIFKVHLQLQMTSSWLPTFDPSSPKAYEREGAGRTTIRIGKSQLWQRACLVKIDN